MTNTKTVSSKMNVQTAIQLVPENIGSASPSILAALVRRHLMECDNDRGLALSAAVDELLNDEKLLTRVLGEVVSEAVDRFVRLDLQGQRTVAINAAISAARQAGTRASESVRSMMDFPMRSGTRLMAATRPEIRATSHHYLQSGSTQVQRGLWLKAVAERLPNDTVPAGTVVRLNEVVKMFNDATSCVLKMGLPYVS